MSAESTTEAVIPDPSMGTRVSRRANKGKRYMDPNFVDPSSVSSLSVVKNEPDEDDDDIICTHGDSLSDLTTKTTTYSLEEVGEGEQKMLKSVKVYLDDDRVKTYARRAYKKRRRHETKKKILKKSHPGIKREDGSTIGVLPEDENAVRAKGMLLDRIRSTIRVDRVATEQEIWHLLKEDFQSFIIRYQKLLLDQKLGSFVYKKAYAFKSPMIQYKCERWRKTKRESADPTVTRANSCSAYISFCHHTLRGQSVVVVRKKLEHTGHDLSRSEENRTNRINRQLLNYVAKLITAGRSNSSVLVSSHRWAMAKGYTDLEDRRYHITKMDVNYVRNCLKANKFKIMKDLDESDNADNTAMNVDTSVISVNRTCLLNTPNSADTSKVPQRSDMQQLTNTAAAVNTASSSVFHHDDAATQVLTDILELHERDNVRATHHPVVEHSVALHGVASSVVTPQPMNNTPTLVNQPHQTAIAQHTRTTSGASQASIVRAVGQQPIIQHSHTSTAVKAIPVVRISTASSNVTMIQPVVATSLHTTEQLVQSNVPTVTRTPQEQSKVVYCNTAVHHGLTTPVMQSHASTNTSVAPTVQPNVPLSTDSALNKDAILKLNHMMDILQHVVVDRDILQQIDLLYDRVYHMSSSAVTLDELQVVNDEVVSSSDPTTYAELMTLSSDHDHAQQVVNSNVILESQQQLVNSGDVEVTAAEQ